MCLLLPTKLPELKSSVEVKMGSWWIARKSIASDKKMHGQSLLSTDAVLTLLKAINALTGIAGVSPALSEAKTGLQWLVF